MKIIEQLAAELKLNLAAILAATEDKPHELWQVLTKKHPAEVAQLFTFLNEAHFIPLFCKFDKDFAQRVFEKLDTEEQVALVENLSEEMVAEIINDLSPEKVIAIFEAIPGLELEKYLKMAHKKRRRSLLSSLECLPDSAGRLANSKIFSLQSEFTVQKSIGIVQALGNSEETPPKIFVVDGHHHLAGFVKLSDLLRHNPTKKIAEILRPIEISVNAHDDQETVVKLFRRYEVLVMPVRDEAGHFLGTISASDILDVVQEEMTEDSFKMSGLSIGKHSYTDTPFFSVVFQRVQWLLPLLLLQSVSAFVLKYFGAAINNNDLLFYFMTTLVSTGGNAGNQSSTLMVRGLVTGEINMRNKGYVFWRELRVAFCTGIILVVFNVFRVLLTPGCTIPSLATISVALLLIVLSSALLGTLIPIILDHFDIDPANSAAPFIATLMDIIGVSIYCLIANLLLR
jgi:magnesium transporter